MSADLKLRATRRLGELSRELEGTGPKGGRPKNVPGSGKVSTKSETLKAAGLSTSAAHRAEKVAEIPEEAFEAYMAKRAAAGKPVTCAEKVAQDGAP